MTGIAGRRTRSLEVLKEKGLASLQTLIPIGGGERI